MTFYILLVNFICCCWFVGPAAALVWLTLEYVWLTLLYVVSFVFIVAYTRQRSHDRNRTLVRYYVIQSRTNVRHLTKVIHNLLTTSSKVIHKLSTLHKSYPQVQESYPQVFHRRRRTCVRRGGGGGRTGVRVAGHLKDSYKFLKPRSLFRIV